MAVNLETFITSGEGIFEALRNGELNALDAHDNVTRLRLDSQACRAELDQDFVPIPDTLTMHEVVEHFSEALVAYKGMKKPRATEIELLGDAVILAWTDHKRRLALEWAIRRVEDAEVTMPTGFDVQLDVYRASERAVKAEKLYRETREGLAEKVARLEAVGA